MSKYDAIQVDKVLVRESRKGRRETVVAFNKPEIEALLGQNDRAGRLPPSQLSLQDIMDFSKALDAGLYSWRDYALLIRGHEERLQAALAGKLPAETLDLQDWAVRLSTYISFIFLPAVAYLGQFELGVEAATKLTRLVTGFQFRRVAGAGAEGDLPEVDNRTGDVKEEFIFRYLLLAPLFNALTENLPSDWRV